jgi:hypothetical protein
MSGVHAKTVLIDRRIVYEGSLNWASQTASFEHMLRFESREIAALYENLLQLRAILKGASSKDRDGSRCPLCGGPLMVVNQRQQSGGDQQPLKLACYRNQTNRRLCEGYMRGVDERLPFLSAPHCSRDEPMQLERNEAGRPQRWRCNHPRCRSIPWRKGDVTPDDGPAPRAGSEE